jgi:tripartite-type tricarboxylate transporter receptor subunit TctC
MKTATTLLVMLAAMLSGGAKGADYPLKPLRLIVGYAQGGGNDIIARLTAAKFQESLGQPVVVENKPGADTIIATDFVAKSPADGYTVLVNAMGGFTITPALHAKLPYDPQRDFTPVGTIAQFPHVLAVNASVPANSVRELVAYAQANPGKLNYGSASTAIRLATEMFLQKTGTSLTHIPYKGSGPSAQALIANEVQVVISDAPPLLAHLASGRVRFLAVTSKERLQAMPDLPTFADTPALAGFDISPWIGLFVPARTPAPIVTTLNAQIVRMVTAPDFRERLKAMGAEAVGDSPEQAAIRVRDDTKRYAEAAKLVNLSADRAK